MTESNEDHGQVSFLRDRASLAVIGLVVVIAIAGTAYGYYTQEESQPGLTLDDIPNVADGSYTYAMTIGIGLLEPVVDVVVTYSDGVLGSVTIDGETVPDDDLAAMVAQFYDSLSGATVETGAEWTDGTETVGTYLVTYGSGTVVYAEDGRILNIIHSRTDYRLEATLDGWEQVSPETEG